MNWEEETIKYMTDKGWKCDINNEEWLGFVLYQDEEHEWRRDYNKKTEKFFQYNGKHKVTLFPSFK